MKTFWKIVAAGLTAFLAWAAFPPMDEAMDIAFVLAPMLALTRLSRPKSAAGWWFASGFAFWFATISWMPAICKNNGPWPLVVLGWIGLAALCAGYMALFGWLDALARDKVGRSRHVNAARLVVLALVEPTLWAGMEWLRATLFSGFAWNFLGTAVGSFPPFATPARLGGVYFLSALVVMVNGVFATLIVRAIAPMARRPGTEEAPARTWVSSLYRTFETALPLLIAYGSLCLSAPATYHPAEPVTLRVALVQRNAPCIFSKRDAEDPYKAFTGLLDKVAPANPDLVVLAESAFAEFGSARSDGVRQAALHFSNRCGGAAVIGGADDSVFTNGERRIYNAAAYYSPSASNALVAVYHKQHLVPFGEYIPFDKIITPLQRLSPLGVSLHPGEPALFDLDGVRLAPLICFEDTVPPLSRRAAADGAHAIVLITNDSWFSHSLEAEQHSRQAVMRAIETGLPVMRVGNSGVTGVIQPSGRARWLTDGAERPLVDQAGCLVESVQIDRSAPKTLYVRLGDAPLLALFSAVLAMVLWRRRH
ncbi:MAG: apolipoprotein N-acyltransferase [Kiritimatiellae bacterium]|nr:apolipoprotein N-acyltransferase [Kiritimatiellia bacterium]